MTLRKLKKIYDLNQLFIKDLNIYIIHYYI
jgi:hypothetical protein